MSTASEYEEYLQRQITTDYIATNPTEAQFVPRVYASDGAGGHVWTNPAPLAAQTIRVITEFSAQQVERRTVEGEVVQPDLIFLCEWDAQVEPGYTLDVEGNTFEVVFILPDMRYEKFCEAVRRA